MSNHRVLRAGFFVMPFLAFGFALASGCSDDEDPNPISTRDGSADVSPIDAKGGTDTSNPGFDSGKDSSLPPQDGGSDANTNTDSGDEDSGITDAGTADADASEEADADAGPQPTALCVTYPNNAGFEDAGAAEPALGRWDLIALRTIFSGINNAVGSCQINAHFTGGAGQPGPGGGTPIEVDCLGQQLRVLTGCATPTSYEVANDQNGAKCISDGGTPQVQLGFYDHNGTFEYHRADIDFLIRLVREAALSTGMPTVDADRLVALLEARRDALVTADAGADAGDAGFSASTCP